MNIVNGLLHLLFNQREFFEHDAPKGVLLPFLLTLLYAAAAVFAALPLLTPAMAQVPAELQGIVLGTSVVSTILTVFISWLIIALIFFALVKIIGYAKCTYKDVLRVTGYVSLLLLINSILAGLVAVIGSANTIALTLLSGAFLLWSIPVWYFGLSSICGDIPQKKLIISIAIPVIIMIIISVASIAMTI